MPDEPLRNLIATHLRVPLEKVTAEADLLEDLGGDSLAFAELTAKLESEFGARLPSDRLADIFTVGDLEQLLAEMRPTEAAASSSPPR